MAKNSVALVIDADIARASSPASKPTPSNCRAFLEAVRACSHDLVMSPEIREEWKKHRSVFARKWQTSMYARKQVRWVEPEHNQELWERVEQEIEQSKQRHAVWKDFHLVEAALVTDKRIASMDEKVRGLLRVAAQKKGAKALKEIMWVNPNICRGQEHAAVTNNGKNGPHPLNPPLPTLGEGEDLAKNPSKIFDF